MIEKIGLTLASSLDEAGRPGGLKPARKLAEDAYWGEFEASDMETAVRIHLGFARAGELEGQFRAMVAGVRDVAAPDSPPSTRPPPAGRLLLGLIKAADDLDRKGVTDRTHIFGMTGGTSTAVGVAAIDVDNNVNVDERRRQLDALDRGFAGVRGSPTAARRTRRPRR